MEEEALTPVVKRNKGGRPTKALINSKKRGQGSGNKVMGRPKGDASRIQEFKARLLGTTGEKIINTLISKALNVDDKDNIAALKMCIDRILPISAFEAAKGSGGVPQVTINISGLNDVKVSEDEVIDV